MSSSLLVSFQTDWITGRSLETVFFSFRRSTRAFGSVKFPEDSPEWEVRGNGGDKTIEEFTTVVQVLVVKVVLFSHFSRSTELVRWKNKVQCCLSTQTPTKKFAGERWGREISAGIDHFGFIFQCYLHGGKSRNQRERKRIYSLHN